MMSVRPKRCTELKVAGAHLHLRINGKTTRVWIGSGSSIASFKIGEIGNTLGAQNVR